MLDDIRNSDILLAKFLYHPKEILHFTIRLQKKPVFVEHLQHFCIISDLDVLFFYSFYYIYLNKIA